MHDSDRDYLSKFTLGVDPESDWGNPYEDDFDYATDEEAFTFDDECIPDADDDDPEENLRFEDW